MMRFTLWHKGFHHGGTVVPLVPVVEKHLVARRLRDRQHLIPTEIDQLIDAARSMRWGGRDSTLLLMMFSHGLRVREATELKWKQLDPDNRVSFPQVRPASRRYSARIAQQSRGVVS